MDRCKLPTCGQCLNSFVMLRLCVRFKEYQQRPQQPCLEVGDHVGGEGAERAAVDGPAPALQQQQLVKGLHARNRLGITMKF